ncbi:MAG: hypothetical protein PHF24_10335 [Syntrophomonas sp.]|nr:hypothetical protein [Syntrophomonas sp.]
MKKGSITMEITDVTENIKKLQNLDYDEMKSQIVTSFAGYSFEGISEIIVIGDPDKELYAYANSLMAPVILIYLNKNEDGTYSVRDAY